MRYWVIVVLLILASCQKKAEVDNSVDVKEEWNPGAKYADTTATYSRHSSGGFFVPFRELGLENTTYAELCKLYGEPESSERGILVNGRSINEMDYDYGQPREQTCAMLYDYINPVIADSLFKDKKCVIQNVVWRVGDSPDEMYVMYLRLYFVGEGDYCYPIWGYKGLETDVYEYVG